MAMASAGVYCASCGAAQNNDSEKLKPCPECDLVHAIVATNAEMNIGLNMRQPAKREQPSYGKSSCSSSPKVHMLVTVPSASYHSISKIPDSHTIAAVKRSVQDVNMS